MFRRLVSLAETRFQHGSANAPLILNDEYTEKTIANAALHRNPSVDFASWEWLNISEWKLAAEPWQKFNEQWYGNTSCATSPGLSIESLVPYLTGNFSTTILVRKCHVEIFNRVWDLAMALDGLKGIIITGQPGSGTYYFPHSSSLQKKR